MLQKLQCPGCNAPLDYKGHESTFRCPYCGTKVVVPESLRKQAPGRQGAPAPHLEQSITVDDLHDAAQFSTPAAVVAQVRRLARTGNKLAAITLFRTAFGTGLAESQEVVERLAAGQTINWSLYEIEADLIPDDEQSVFTQPVVYKTKAGNGLLGCIMTLITLVIIGGAGVFIFLSATGDATQIIEEVTSVTSNTFSTLNETGAISLPASLSDDMFGAFNSTLQQVTGGFATETMRFGSEGVGPGKFKDARAIAVDNQGHIFVGEFDTGRVQVFDMNGKYLSQWNLKESAGSDNAYILGFAADRQSRLYATVMVELYQFNGLTGELLHQYPGLDPYSGTGWYSDGAAISSDGKLHAENEGHIVRFNSDYEVELTIEDAFENATGETETSVKLAVDGLGNIYALGTSSEVVAKFSANGRFLDRFGGRAEGVDPQPGTLRAASAMAIDSQLRVYIGDIDGVKVFSSEGQYLATIDTPGYPYGLTISDDDKLFVSIGTAVVQYELPTPE